MLSTLQRGLLNISGLGISGIPAVSGQLNNNGVATNGEIFPKFWLGQRTCVGLGIFLVKTVYFLVTLVSIPINFLDRNFIFVDEWAHETYFVLSKTSHKPRQIWNYTNFRSNLYCHHAPCKKILRFWFFIEFVNCLRFNTNISPIEQNFQMIKSWRLVIALKNEKSYWMSGWKL